MDAARAEKLAGRLERATTARSQRGVSARVRTCACRHAACESCTRLAGKKEGRRKTAMPAATQPLLDLSSFSLLQRLAALRAQRSQIKRRTCIRPRTYPLLPSAAVVTTAAN